MTFPHLEEGGEGVFLEQTILYFPLRAPHGFSPPFPLSFLKGGLKASCKEAKTPMGQPPSDIPLPSPSWPLQALPPPPPPPPPTFARCFALEERPLWGGRADSLLGTRGVSAAQASSSSCLFLSFFLSAGMAEFLDLESSVDEDVGAPVCSSRFMFGW